MKIARVYFVLPFIAIASLFGCNDAPQPHVHIDTVKENNNARLKQDIRQSQVQLEKTPIAPHFEIPKGQLKPSDLIKFIPEILAGSHLASPSSGASRRSEKTAWTKASGIYKLSGEGNAFLTITDYGEELPDDMKKRFEPPFKEEGLIVEKLATPDGAGYRVYNESSKIGSIAILVVGRIGLELEVTGYPSRDFDKLINAVDVAGLAKAAKLKSQ